MFHRRLLLLIGVLFLLAGVMVLQLFNLTLVQGARLRVKAEDALSETTLVPTVRGKVMDRKGRLLAVDVPSDDIAVNYRAITGEWAYRRAREVVFNANRQRWSELGYDERERLIEEAEKPFDLQLETLWKTLCAAGGFDRAEMESRKALIIERVQKIAVSVSINQQTMFDDPAQSAIGDVREQRLPHAVLTGVDEKSVARIRQLMVQAKSEPSLEVWQQVSIQPSKTRSYPLETLTVTLDRKAMPSPLRSEEPLTLTVEGVGTHALGILRSVWRADITGRPFGSGEREDKAADLGGYLPGDRTGAWGIEKSMEPLLRGLRGSLTRRLDTQAEEVISPVPGQDVTLTLDIALQARVQAIMDARTGLMKVQEWNSKDLSDNPLRPQLGEPLNGAAVVIDIATGEVLAAVSMPGMPLKTLREDPDKILKDQINRPYINRAVGQAFQPGSTVKPLVLAAAVTDRKIGYNETVDCEGHLLPNNLLKYRCWIFKQYHRTHGPLEGPEAIARSCNIFFYTMGRRLGAQRLVAWYDRFGVGRINGCGLSEEIKGDLPSSADATAPHARGFSVDDAINMGIGQGPIQWTPLQAAGAYATLMRGGIYIAPTFIKSPQDPARKPVSLDLDPKGIEMAKQGLDMAVNAKIGTANHLAMLNNELIITAPGVKAMGKSGTAEPPDLRVDTNDDGRITRDDEVVRKGDHAWFMVVVQGEKSARPQYVIAVVVEYGGMGAAVAGPVANQIILALREEGYF
ncbi:MAG: hypothetical protein K8S99_07670 [Planctomycetes bacterium]|nr:hypothetical protein [Planctomycetota bacterium]